MINWDSSNGVSQDAPSVVEGLVEESKSDKIFPSIYTHSRARYTQPTKSVQV